MGQDDQALRTTPALAPARPTCVRYLVLAVACSLAVLTYVQRQGFIAATPYLKEHFHLDDNQMGFFFIAVWLVAYGLFQVPGGLIGDRIGSRHLLTLLVVGWSLTLGAVALTVFLPVGGWLPLAVLLGLRFLFGSFQAGVFPGLARVVADWMPAQRRGFAQGSIWTCSRLGGAVAPLLVVWLITWVFRGGWAPPLALLAAFGLVWSTLFWLWFRNRPQEMRTVNAAEVELISSDRPAAPERTGPVPWLALLRSPSVWGLCLMYGFVGFAGNFVTNFLNIYLRDHRKLDDNTTALLAGLPLAAGVVSCLLGGVVSDWLIRRLGSRKWGRRLVGLVALALAGLASLLTPWVQEAWLLALSISAWMFFNDATMGPAWASCADVGERYAGTLSGAMNMIGAFLGAAGMLLAGQLLDRHAYEIMFVIFACSYVLAALCWLAVDVTKPLVPPGEQGGPG
ncbi:MAG TPA: MFS transporter [Gemmataceae bacterium]|nr:MFS transporter [Gemmataceae bacterium]